jgi:hypothetical protein
MLGNSPRRWRRAQAYIDITHTLELKHKTLPISRSTLSLRDPFLPVLEQIFIYDQISQISFFLYNVRLFEFFLFLFTNLIIYIEIWQVYCVDCYTNCCPTTRPCHCRRCNQNACNMDIHHLMTPRVVISRRGMPCVRHGASTWRFKEMKTLEIQPRGLSCRDNSLVLHDKSREAWPAGFKVDTILIDTPQASDITLLISPPRMQIILANNPRVSRIFYTNVEHGSFK